MELDYLPNRGILMKADGIVTFKDIKEINDEIYGTKEKILSISYRICDFTNIQGEPLSVDEVKTLAEQDKYAAEINPDMIIATVAESDVIFGLSRMWQSFTADSNAKTKVFRKMPDAQRWIAKMINSKKVGKYE
jgi:hypothetical protein